MADTQVTTPASRRFPARDWPFLDDSHRELIARLEALPVTPHHEPKTQEELAQQARGVLPMLAASGLIDYVVPKPSADGQRRIDLRAVCLLREYFGYHDLLADTMLTMQGIGTAAIWIGGSAELKDRYLELCRQGKAIAALALTEPEAGSDVASAATSAVRDGDEYVINGDKTLITNAGIADHYIVIARTGEAPGAKGLSAFMVDAGTPGLEVVETLDFIVPHPLGTLAFRDCRIPAANMIGGPGQGFKAAMATFDIFRASVGAAGVGVACRALDESVGRAKTRRLFGKTMAEIEGVQTRIAEMTVDIETAALAVYRAAWAKDVNGGRCSREASLAKLVGSEAAFRVVDAAVQLFGGRGLLKGNVIEQLYREVRGMRIYEGASEVQKMIIARDVLA